MPARNAMTMRATIERATTSVDALGQDSISSWSTLHSSLPCRVWTRAELETANGSIFVNNAGHRLMIPLGTDITEKDRVTAVKDRKGTSLISNTMQIRAVIRRTDHKEIHLTEIV